GASIGDVNRQSIEEIWNGPGYRELRRLNASGDFPAQHPCHPDNCLTRRSTGVYPAFHAGSVNITKNGYGYVIPIPEAFVAIIAAEGAPPCLVFEDEAPLPHPDAIHVDVFEQGRGRYSVWGNWLYLSSSDGSDPCENGRNYTFRCGERRADVPLPYRRNCRSGENIAQALRDYQDGRTTMAAKPTSIQIATTADCNIDCPHCCQNPLRALDVKLRPEVVDEVLALVPYLQEFMWFGGEPYLVGRFRRFIDEFEPAGNPNLCFGFTSNGTMLTDGEVAKLLKFPRLNAAISFDSFNPATFERVRQGARFERVLANLERCVALYDRSNRVFTVGMTVLKSTIGEIADNVRAAIARDIPLNLSPCLGYPMHERLDVFHDFARETAAWPEALAEAVALVQEARRQGRKSVLRNDIEGSLRELQAQYERSRARYARSVKVRFRFADPHDSLGRMRKPALIVTRVMAEAVPLAAVLLDGAGECELGLPLQDLAGDFRPFWYLTDDVNEEGWVLADEFRDAHGIVLPSGRAISALATRVAVEIPDFSPAPVVRNVVLAKRTKSTAGSRFESDSALSLARRAHYAEIHGLLARGENFMTSAQRRTWQAGRVRYDEFIDISGLDG
ncbi:MAG TPA: radical SAM protein, partial [Rhodocyclaceae bacterium]|nr:radical SAM protein [Rhodocyclaceae bacterium]